MTSRSIVVIGASAGGVRALSRVLNNLPADLPASVFIVLHRAEMEVHNDILAYVLEQQGPLPVESAVDLKRFQPGHIYVAPPDHHLSIENGLMRVERSPKERHFRPSIDALFRSAAINYGREVIAIIMTGMLDDGTVGLWQVKKRGGVTIAQDPADAEHASMPQAALDNVAVDYVLRVEDIARKIVELTAPQPAGAHTAMPKVLIVEDELIVAKSLREQLQDLCYTVTGAAASAETALAMVADDPPDVVLMDIRLAGAMSGVAAARRIWERWQIPVVFITAHADRDTLAEVKTTESYGYIVKPFNAERVDAAIQLALDRRKKEWCQAHPL